jgi:type I restriction-modification system DNA methylase subunit
VTGDLKYADRLRKTVNALRGQVDAAEYKHVVLGLPFVKYISDSFASQKRAKRESASPGRWELRRLEQAVNQTADTTERSQERSVDISF